MKNKLTLVLLIFSLCHLWSFGQICEKNFLSVNSNKLFDAKGNKVQLTGVNWFGFETNELLVHGLWTRDMKSSLQQIKDLGFNCIRIPWCNDIIEGNVKINSYGTDSYTGVSPMNAEESTKTKSIEILDILIQWCQDNDMKVILDNHSREPGGYMVEQLWYTAKVSHQKWISDWVFIANRYKDFDAVIAMDINNEPHGAYGAGSRWGTGDIRNDWRLAAQECGNAILNTNPHVLIMVEGTEEFRETSYWWGGNLQGAKEFPVVLSNPNKLVYSPHEYGPTVHNQHWFSDPTFPANMPAIWEQNFNYLHTNGTSPLFIGEFGIRDPGGKDEVWFDAFLEYMEQKGHHWTFWCWNPNSGDTGGLLDDQWKNVVQWKMNKLRPHLEPEIPNCKSVSEPVDVSGIVLSPENLSIKEGNSYQLNGYVLPSNATNKNISWGTNTPSVVTVSQSGLLTAISSGQAIITVTSEDGAFTAQSKITVNTGSSPGGCDFNVPISTPLPSINKAFNNIHVTDNGPDLSSVTNLTINWDLVNNGLWQFSINTNNGQPDWYIDLRASADHTFGEVNPSITITGSDISGLDGSYFVTLDQNNFVMVHQAGLHTIYCNNSPSFPCQTLKGTSALLNSDISDGILVYPIPFKESLNIELKNNLSVESIEVLNNLGQIIYKINKPSNTETIHSPSSETDGLYILKVNTKNFVFTRPILKN